MPNRLADSTSPYLLQHSSNPVDWYPWGPEALSRARAENKPIFLSIGYAACHWCHVMAHESFEDPETAALLNANFVAIKVDREERPDIDSIYMQATFSLTGSGGWPMSVFLTPDLRPFYAGTYFPPVGRFGLPGFADVVTEMARIWKENPEDIARVSTQVAESLAVGRPAISDGVAPGKALHDATITLIKSADREHGGWGSAPKFPQPMAIEFLFRRSLNHGRVLGEAADVALGSLQAMARGGMYDVVGGGFSRYSTDRTWHVPHFEKMLYDNAQLALAYLHAWQVTRELFYKRIMTETLDFVIRELTDAAGGFYSSLDADSDGDEGKFYVWTPDEVLEVLHEKSLLTMFRDAYGILPTGTEEQRIVLQRVLDDDTLAARFGSDPFSVEEQLSRCHKLLREARGQRTRPTTDDKVITAWNGLMLNAFAQAARYVEAPASKSLYLTVATRNADFLLRELNPDGRLRRSWRRGSLGHTAFLDDYASLVVGLLELYQASFDERWFTAAVQLGHNMIDLFADPAGGFFDTPVDGEALVIRPKDLQDNAVPSGNALAAEALLKLAAFTGESDLRKRAEDAVRSVIGQAALYPTSYGHWLNVADFAQGGEQQLALVYPAGHHDSELLDLVNSEYRPNLVVAAGTFPPSPTAPPLLDDRAPLNNRPTAFLCHDFICQLPLTEATDLKGLL